MKQIIVELLGVKDPERAIRLIGETALMEFVEAKILDDKLLTLTDEQKALIIGDNKEVKLYSVTDSQGNVYQRPVAIGKRALTGSDLKDAAPATNDRGFPVVSIQFTSDGGQKFFDLANVRSDNILPFCWMGRSFQSLQLVNLYQVEMQL